MKIDFFMSANVHGGPARVVSEVSAELARRGHDVEVVVPLIPHWTYRRLVTMRGASPVRSLAYAGKTLIKEAVLNRFQWTGRSRSPVAVRRCLTTPGRPRRDADWVFLANNWYQVYEWPSFDGWSERVVQLAYHYEEHQDAETRRLVHEAYARPFRRMTLCRAAADELAAHGVQTDGILFLGINPAVFHPHGAGRREKSLVLYWGLEPRKGAEAGLRAAELVRRRLPEIPIKLLCADARQKLPAGYAGVRAVSDREMAALYRENAVFIYPSLKEGFGLPPLEAMACGAAVAATKTGAVPEFARDGQDALLREPGDPAALAEAAIKLLEDDSLRRRLGESGAARAESYTWARTVDGLLAYLAK